MLPPSKTGLRHRTAALEQTIAQERQSRTVTATITGGTSTDNKVGNDKVVFRKEKHFYDISIKGFHKKQAAGEIFNNPMIRTEEEFKVPLIKYSRSWEVHNNHLETIKGTISVPPPADHSYPDDISGLIDNAIVDAYAGISANEGNTLLWLGEMKETISMLMSIGTQLKTLYQSTKAARKAWAKGKLSVKEQQGLTLAIVFGILPLEQQIADFMDGLFKIKQLQSRQTARGFRVKTKSVNGNEGSTAGRFVRTLDNNVQLYPSHQWTEHLEIQVRAGVLYEIDIDANLPWLAVIADPKQVVSTAYALARMSFVIDWFVNVGGVLSAWAPTAGTKELSAWVTVDVTSTIVGSTDLMHNAGDISSIVGTSSWQKVSRTKWRKAVSRADLAIFPPLDINLDVSKLLLLVLLFAKIK